MKSHLIYFTILSESEGLVELTNPRTDIWIQLEMTSFWGFWIGGKQILELGKTFLNGDRDLVHREPLNLKYFLAESELRGGEFA